MELIYDITLRLVPSGEIPVVRVKQGDTSTRFVRITVRQGDTVYIPGAEQTILFREEKPDKTSILVDSVYEDTELERYLITVDTFGRITLELTDQMVSCNGYCKCDLCFISGENALSTAPFLIEVDGMPDVSESAVSSDDFRTLINALRDVGLSSTTQLTDMTDVLLDGAVDRQILVYDGSSHKWVNQSINIYGLQTESQVNNLITQRGYQTEVQVNTLIEQYIQSLDGNNTEY